MMTVINRDNYQLFCKEPSLTEEEERILREMRRAVSGQIMHRDASLALFIIDATRAECEASTAAGRRVTDDWSDVVGVADAHRRLERARIKAFQGIHPRCWCGASLHFAGVGAYPYECEAKDKHPTALVFAGCDNGHTGWEYWPNNK